MLVAADEELRNSLRDIKKLNHFDGRYVLQLKSEIFIAQKMNVESETIRKIIDEIGFDEPISAKRICRYRTNDNRTLEGAEEL